MIFILFENVVRLLLGHSRATITPTLGLLPPEQPGWVNKCSFKPIFNPVCSARWYPVRFLVGWKEESATVHPVLLGCAADSVLLLAPVRQLPSGTWYMVCSGSAL